MEWLVRERFKYQICDLECRSFSTLESSINICDINWNFHRSGFKPRRSLEVILFTSEEPTRFGISCLGRSETAIVYCLRIRLVLVVIFVDKSTVHFNPLNLCYLTISGWLSYTPFSTFHHLSLVCSRLLAGSENLSSALKTTTDSQNISFLDAARSAGYAKDEDDLSSVFLKKGTYSAFVELHIEQGPILEDEGTHLWANV